MTTRRLQAAQLDLAEQLDMIRRSGLEPLVCDVPVRLSSCPVRCGQPAAPGDDDMQDYVLLPRQLMGQHPEIFIPVMGDSMRDAGYDAGDRLRVLLGASVHDGDNVLASIDGCCTVKTYCHDEDDQPWLVPQNSEMDAIRLTADMDVRILGRVAGVEKSTLRAAFRDCQNSIRRTKRKQQQDRPLSPERVDAVIGAMSPLVVHARQWYAVFRALQDHQPAAASSITAFCLRVHRQLPAHAHLPQPKELQRMAVLSFAKPVALWSAANAPVRGSRYADYLHIAHATAELLADSN